MHLVTFDQAKHVAKVVDSPGNTALRTPLVEQHRDAVRLAGAQGFEQRVLQRVSINADRCRTAWMPAQVDAWSHVWAAAAMLLVVQIAARHASRVAQ